MGKQNSKIERSKPVNNRIIEIECKETYLALLHDLGRQLGYACAEDYVAAIIARYVFNKLEHLYGGNDKEWEFRRGLTDTQYIDDLPF